jgi:hypothetical protein
MKCFQSLLIATAPTSRAWFRQRVLAEMAAELLSHVVAALHAVALGHRNDRDMPMTTTEPSVSPVCPQTVVSGRPAGHPRVRFVRSVHGLIGPHDGG